MSDAPAPVAAPAATASPEAAPRSTVDMQRKRIKAPSGPTTKAKDAFNQQAEARKALRDLRSLRLVKPGEKRNPTEKATEALPKPGPEPVEFGEAQEAKATEAAEPEAPNELEAAAEDSEPEAEPSWAKKLKTDHERVTKEAAQLKQAAKEREYKVERMIGEYKAKVEDLVEEAQFNRSYADQLKNLLRQAGHEIDPVSEQLFMAQRELGKMKKFQERGSRTQNEAQTSTMSKTIQDRLHALRGKHPEIDWTKNSDARAKVQDILENTVLFDKEGRFLDNVLTKKVEEFIGYQRWKAAQANKPAPKPQPAQAGARPPSSTLAGAQPSAGKKSKQPPVITNSLARQMLREHKARRQSQG